MDWKCLLVEKLLPMFTVDRIIMMAIIYGLWRSNSKYQDKIFEAIDRVRELSGILDKVITELEKKED